MKRYKLTEQDCTTYKGYVVPTDGSWYKPENLKDAPQACSGTVLHHYANPYLAVLLNPCHADYKNPRLFEIQVNKEIGTDGLKGWSRAQRVVREVPVPIVTTTQKVAFALKVALLVYKEPEFVLWATAWLDGTDRTANAAYAAADAANAAVDAANAAAYAAYAAYAANAAAYAAADAATAAAYAAAYAAYTADTAAYAADTAAYAAELSYQLVQIIKDVMLNF